MHQQTLTKGIILSRTDFGEADRIITILTPDHGKLRLMAKGVRKAKSKLAGGIELFSVSDITFIKGRGDIGTLISTRLDTHYEAIVQDIERTMLGYELIKLLNKVTEEEPDNNYFLLLEQTFQALNDKQIGLQIITLWFYMQLLRLSGHTPNLSIDSTNKKLEQGKDYIFSFDDMSFSERKGAPYGTDHIKLLRIGFSGNGAKILQQISNIDKLVTDCLQLVGTMLNYYVRR